MTDDQDIASECLDYFNGQATNLLFILDYDGKIIKANSYAKDMISEDVLGKKFQDIIVDFHDKYDLESNDFNSEKEQLLNIVNKSGLPQSYYFKFKKKPEYIIAFGRFDAQEIESMRREILALNQDLNNLTRELHKNNAQLKKLNEEKNRFLGMAAHDLRKPIGLILTYSEFLIDEAASVLDEEHAGFLNTINASSSFMKRLVDDFLDISAIEAGKFETDLQPCSITEVVKSSLELNHFQARKKDINIKLDLAENAPRVMMDGAKIEQVITNLVSNAIEHSDAGSRVSVGMVCDSDEILFKVEDHGPGIAPEDLEKLFRPFEKTKARKTGGEKSTGLGMLIARKIIEAHKGTIWVESEQGRGTTVHFKLPIRQDQFLP